MSGEQVSIGALRLTGGCLGCSLGWRIATSWAVTVSHPLSVPEALLMTALYLPLMPPLRNVLSTAQSSHGRGSENREKISGLGSGDSDSD